MHIKKLEICGFKSFADRTTIHFDHDIIGVVGPNGCGKSNVVDSIRWVMGEQSAKALRGKAMGDVIFNGSETRPQAGFAEVTITFDNGDPAMAQMLPLEYRDYAEISVTRRLYRGDGSNDYFINKVAVRLRDVTEVFLGTGVGRKAYSIVEQGKIGLIVSARAEDRRSLIEEAAGITKYKARRRQAENKMKLTRDNLVRIGDIVSEIERQLGSLKRQAAKAERYVRYRKELDDLVLWEASHRWLELARATQLVDEQRTSAEDEVKQTRTSLDTRDTELEVMRHQQRETEQEAERAQSAAFASDNLVREHDLSIERFATRYQMMTERLEQARQEVATLRGRRETLVAEAVAIDQNLEDIQSTQAQSEELLAAEQQQLESRREESETADGTLEQIRLKLSHAATDIARYEAELSAADRGYDERRERLDRFGLERDRLTEEHTVVTAKLADAAVTLKALEASHGELVAQKAAHDTRGPELEQANQESQAQLRRAQAAAQEHHSQLKALTDLSQRMEGVGAGVKELLGRRDPTLEGLASDRLRVPPEYTAAVAGLLGSALESVVVGHRDDALTHLEKLAADGTGRVSLIPRDGSASAAASDAGAIDPRAKRLADCIGCHDPKDAPLLELLFEDSLVVGSIQDGAALATELHRLQTAPLIVCLDGTVFHRGGRITGGTGDGLAAARLEQQRQIRQLEAATGSLQEQVAAAEAECSAADAKLAEQREGVESARHRLHEADIGLVTARQEGQQLAQQGAAIKNRLDQLEDEHVRLKEAMLTAEVAHQSSSKALISARAACEEATTAQVDADQKAREARAALQDQQTRFTEHKVQFASIQERLSNQRAAQQRMTHERSSIDGRLHDLEHERHQAAQEAGELAGSMVLAREELLLARDEAREARAAFETVRMGLDDTRHALAVQEAELRTQRRDLEDAAKRLQQHEMDIQRLTLERDHLNEGIAERFRGLEIRSVVGDYHCRPMLTAVQTQRNRELARTIDRMGSVNLDAMKEYDESSERYTYYTTQRDDLERALTDLETAINTMNRESKRLFRHAYDGINRRFKEIFPKMFRGGKAELRLTDPDNLLDTGIDILAQPPGKRLGNLELMSGGEKAFTAVSLLLAIFRFKPSPFCILDEVDAPLDEANVERYVEGIRAMTDRSQFIVITHSKRTMQAVDVLYGVTMQDPGVSKLVGVRVGDGVTRTARRTAESEAQAAAEIDNVTDGSETKEAESDTSTQAVVA